jgi:hypothetical protein
LKERKPGREVLPKQLADRAGHAKDAECFRSYASFSIHRRGLDHHELETAAPMDIPFLSPFDTRAGADFSTIHGMTLSIASGRLMTLR